MSTGHRARPTAGIPPQKESCPWAPSSCTRPWRGPGPSATRQYAGRPHGGEVVPRLTAGELEKLRPELSDGMVPKMTGCVHAEQMFTDDGFGTVIVPAPDEPEALR
ncbi:hypothetical protein ACIBW9_40650 [Streptomyces sp. NPDC049541]|uniref:hypothetical protein n=1 Tax=Streptomyces sp. NPDC049541 TaxID=3365594 RepID=UPI0037BA60B2